MAKTFAEAIAQKKAEREAAAKQTQPVTNGHTNGFHKTVEPQEPSRFQDLVPEDSRSAEQVHSDKVVEQTLEQVNVVDAYVKFIGKMIPSIAPGQRESIMISCPLPTHADKDPSAWCNLDNNTWFCGGCQVGGDVYGLGAIGLGKTNNPQSDQSWKEGAAFPQLRREMAEAFGANLYLPPVELPPIEEKPVSLAPPPPPAPPVIKESAPAVPVLAPVPEPEPEASPEPVSLDPTAHFPRVDWRKVAPEGTFLRTWMEILSQDQLCEEYHFWHGMLALGLAVGRDVQLYDSPNVNANLFVCLLGRTGDGKSRAKRYLDMCLAQALPYDRSNPYSKGVKPIPSPSSGEVLVKMFDAPVEDLTVPPQKGMKPKIIDHAPVRGLIDISELQTLVSKMGRVGNTMGPMFIDFYDCKDLVSDTSLTSGEKLAKFPFASVLSTTQPEVLADLLSDKDEASGWLNRWLFVGGPSKPQSFFNHFAPDISPAAKLLGDIHVWAEVSRTTRIVELDMAARDQAEKDWNDTLAPLILADTTKALTRLSVTLKKLCLLFAINEKSMVITLDIWNKAMSLVPYLLSFFQIRTENMSKHKVDTVEKDILSDLIYLQKKNGNQMVPVRELMRKLGRKIPNSNVLNQKLKSLEGTGMVVLQETRSNTRGPATKTVGYIGGGE